MNIPPKKILLSTDGEHEGNIAAEAAIHLANRAGAELHIAHAWAPIHHDTYPVACCSRTPDYSHLYEEDAQKVIKEQVAHIHNRERGSGTVKGAHLQRGRPVNEICNLSEELGVDLTILGSNTPSSIGRAFLSGFSKGFLRKASCAVLIVREGEEAWPPSYISLGEGLSEPDRETVRLAESLGKLLEAPVLDKQAKQRQELSIPFDANDRNTKVRVASMSPNAWTQGILVVSAEDFNGTRRIKKRIKASTNRKLLESQYCSILVGPKRA